MTEYAPILIPTLCRFEHFKRCVESLAACTHANKTDLFIALDYPCKEDHWNGYRRIEAYLGGVKGFASIHIIRRAENYGAVRNFIESRSEIFSKYDKLIFSEDDNEFSPNFLDYINKGLHRFEKDTDVIAICGYHYPVEARTSPDTNYYLWRTFSAWGYGEWKAKPLKWKYSQRELVAMSKDLTVMRNMMERTSKAFCSFVDVLNSGRDAFGDIAIGIGLSREPRLRCVFPCVTKVRNHGHDGSGVNCTADVHAPFGEQSIDTSRVFAFRQAVEVGGSVLNRELKRYFRPPVRSLVRAIQSYVVCRAMAVKSGHWTPGSPPC